MVCQCPTPVWFLYLKAYCQNMPLALLRLLVLSWPACLALEPGVRNHTQRQTISFI